MDHEYNYSSVSFTQHLHRSSNKISIWQKLLFKHNNKKHSTGFHLEIFVWGGTGEVDSIVSL